MECNKTLMRCQEILLKKEICNYLANTSNIFTLLADIKKITLMFKNTGYPQKRPFIGQLAAFLNKVLY